jgi:hypothetical protein
MVPQLGSLWGALRFAPATAASDIGICMDYDEFFTGRNGLLEMTNFTRPADDAKSIVATRPEPLPLRAMTRPKP